MTQLPRENNSYLTGEYSIADMAAYPWVGVSEWTTLDIKDFPNLEAWYQNISRRLIASTRSKNADLQGSAPSFEEDSGVLRVKKELNCILVSVEGSVNSAARSKNRVRVACLWGAGSYCNQDLVDRR